MNALHPRVRVVWIVSSLLLAAVVGAGAAAVDRTVRPLGLPVIAGVAVALAALGIVHALLRYRRWRYELREGSLHLERGVVTEVTTSVPYVRVQHVDTQRGPLERLVGLSSVVVYTAGSRGADVTVPGLTPDRATALRERLRDLAIESEDEAV